MKFVKSLLFSLVLFLGLLRFSPQASAATITVTSNGNSGAGTLRQATYDVADGDTIDFNLGAGNETIVVSSAISLPWGKDVTIDGDNAAGSGTDITVQVSSPGASAYQVFQISSGAGKTATLKNMTLRGGNISAGSGGTIYMYSTNASLIIDNCTIKDGRARFGAGLWANSFSSLTITNSTIQDNNSTDHGGAMRIDSFSGTVSISNTTFNNNTSTNTGGNYYGGAIYFQNNSSQGTVIIDKSTFSNNSVYSSGGGVYSKNVSSLTITNSTFNSNQTSSGGGGLYVYGGTAIVTNSTFTGNSSRYSGGGVYLGGSTSTLTNVTIANNNATDSDNDGLYLSSGTLYLKNSILANHTTNDFANSSGTVNDSGYNLVENSSNYTWQATGDITGNQASLNISGSLADNSTTYGTQTLALSAGSVAIDAANDTSHNGVDVPGLDQRGLYRSSTTDIGAFEYGGTLTPNTHTLTYTAGANGSITGSSPQTVMDGNDGSAVTAVPDSGYVFVDWSDSSTNNPRTDSNVTADVSVTANFQLESAPTITAVSAVAATDSVAISWTTDEASSSQVEYGLISSYGNQTSETDTSHRLTAHSVSVSSLKSCKRYYYRVKSKDSFDTLGVSSAKTFTTTGCPVTTIESGAETNITTLSGGEFELINNSSTAKLVVPDGFASENADFQINRLSTTNIPTPPVNVVLADENIFDLAAVDAVNHELTTFDKEITFVVTYGADTETSFEEDSLDIYRYNSTSGVWDDKDCVLDTVANTLTCSLNSFSTYAVFGEEKSSVSPGNSADETASDSDSSTSSLAAVECYDLPPGNAPDLFRIDSYLNSAVLYFAPATDMDQYFISFSENELAEEHGAMVNLAHDGVQTFMVEFLKPGTTYYFKVRAQNGCMPGAWSEIRSARTSLLNPKISEAELMSDPDVEVKTQEVLGETTIEEISEAVVEEIPVTEESFWGNMISKFKAWW